MASLQLAQCIENKACEHLANTIPMTTTCSNQRQFRDPKSPLYIPGTSGFPIEDDIVMPSKWPILGAQGSSQCNFTLGNPEWGFSDDFPLRMRVAKVDMLGTGEVCPIGRVF